MLKPLNAAWSIYQIISSLHFKKPRIQTFIKVIFLNGSTEKRLFVTECNTMVEGVDHKKNKEKEDFMYSVTRN